MFERLKYTTVKQRLQTEQRQKTIFWKNLCDIPRFFWIFTGKITFEQLFYMDAIKEALIPHSCPDGGIGRRNRLKICRPQGLRVQVPFRVPFFLSTDSAGQNGTLHCGGGLPSLRSDSASPPLPVKSRITAPPPLFRPVCQLKKLLLSPTYFKRCCVPPSPTQGHWITMGDWAVFVEF